LKSLVRSAYQIDPRAAAPTDLSHGDVGWVRREKSLEKTRNPLLPQDAQLPPLVRRRIEASRVWKNFSSGQSAQPEQRGPLARRVAGRKSKMNPSAQGKEG